MLGPIIGVVLAVVFIFCIAVLPEILYRRASLREELSKKFPASVVIRGKSWRWKSTVHADINALTWCSVEARTRRGCTRKTARKLYAARMYLNDSGTRINM